MQLEKKYQKEYKASYKTALEDHEAVVQPLMREYELAWDAERKALCDIPKPDNYNPNDYCFQPDVSFPELPELEFSFSQPTSAEALEADLTEGSFETLERINAATNMESYEEITEKIEEEINIENLRITDNTIFSLPILITGGIIISSPEPGPTTPPVAIEPSFIPKKFGIRQIGIADYKKVVSHVCCYDAGEVSLIENIMAKEVRSKTTTRERIEEFTETTETQQETA